MRAAALLLLLSQFAFAQSQSTPRPEDLGTVTGHITCADTQRPARNAQVSLIATKAPPGYDAQHEIPFVQEAGEGPVHTDLTGGYTLTGVAPGQYYLSVELPGYVTPSSQFTIEELHAPTPEIQQRVRDLQIVTVTPNSTAQADVTIRRAGSISGTVLWDDGSPAIDIDIRILRHYAKSIRSKLEGKIPDTATDSHGRFTVESLSPGEYSVAAVLRANERRPSQWTFADGTKKDFLDELPALFVPVYSPGVFRDKNAAVVKVDAGEETEGIDVTIPIGRLHQISGTLLARDGHTINAGKVSLLFADDRSRFATADINNGAFRLSYVPEGSYMLEVTAGRDVIYGLTFNGSIPPTRTEARTLRTYGTLEQPLTVHTDIQSLNLILPDKPTTTASE